MKNKYKKWLYSIAMIALFLLLPNTSILADVGDFYSPCAVVEDGSGSNVYVAENTANQVEQINTGSQTVTDTYSLTDAPSGVAIYGTNLYVTAGGYEGKVFVVDTSSGSVTDTINVGHTPMSPVLNGSGTELYIANRFDDTVSVIDTSSNSVVATIAVICQPVAVAITPNSSYLVVANHLTVDAADTGDTSAEVSIISTSTRSVTDTIVLPNGSTGLRGVCVSPDGNYAYVSHVLGRYAVHPTELRRGWVWTNAVSIINMSTRAYLNTVLVDDTVKGAANPWGTICSDDGNWLCVAHSGTHELSVIDRTGLHSRLNDLAGYASAGGFAATAAEVVNDLGFMQGLRDRITLNGNGPRAIAMIGSVAYVTEYFSDSVSILDTSVASPTVDSVTLGPQNPLTQVREGEMLYNDATGTMGSWLSCASCHPDVRADGLNWDLANDGMGNPRSAKSLLLSHYTPPAMITGVRPDAETAVRAGFKFIAFAVRPEADALAIDEYLKSLELESSPYLVNGLLSAAAQNGQTIFNNRCASCHSGIFYTDMLKHDVGTGYGSGEEFDTPTLVEIWRTGPYLQDGCAATMMDVLTTYNNGHYDDSGLTSGDLEDLAEYTLSIGPLYDLTDFDPPTPDPMTWASVPSASESYVSMTATTATDASGFVQYYFDETSGNPGATDSGWQWIADYTDTGLDSVTQYCYRVKARDKSPNQNETAWSSPDACATTDAAAPPEPDPATWAYVPSADSCSAISMTATTGTDPSGVEYFFDETSGNPGGSDSGWQSSESYTDTGLDAATQYTYRVRMRDQAPGQNTGSWSTSESATTQTPPCPGGVYTDYVGAGHTTDVTASASSFDPGTPASKTIDASGLTGEQHSTYWEDGWVSDIDAGSPPAQSPNPARGVSQWVYYNLGHKYPLGVMHVWNSNENYWQDETDRGLNSVTIDYSYDGTSWTELGTYSWPRAPGVDTYTGFDGPNFGGACAQYVLITINSNHGDPADYGLSEIKINIAGPPDEDPPTPDPMTWASVPTADDADSISMTATTATDPSGVEYYFDETSGNPGGTDGDWQASESYTDTGLSPETQYCYEVKARDQSVNHNTTAPSTNECATTTSWYKDYADSDIPVSGTVSGSYTDTQASDDVYESITEEESGGKPTSRYSYLEHKWTINVTGGSTVTFFVEAYHTYNSEGDDFVFAYSTTGVDGTYTDMVTVTKTADDDTPQSYGLPGGTSGTVHIRVVDADRTQGNRNLDTVYIDQMYIKSEVGPPDTDPPTPDPMTWSSPPSAESPSAISMTATTATDPSGVEYYFNETSGNPGGSDSSWQADPGYTDDGLSASTQYCYRVQARDKSPNQNATAWSSPDACATTPAECTPTDMHIESVVCSEVSCGPPNNNGRATVTIYDDCGDPVVNALVDGTFSGDFNETFYDVPTDENGVAVFTTAGCVKKPTFSFTVDDVTDTLPHDPGDDLATGCSG